jgi:cytochrome oxidase Cu insertion factor (SCO1/SenC/PrrC family)
MQNEDQLSELARQRKGRMVFMLMVIFFVVPILVVLLMYKLNWKPSGTSSGELINPARLLTVPMELKNNDGLRLPAGLWKDRWSIVYLTGTCEKACWNKMRDLRQLHVSLYKDMPRAQRVLITTTQDVSDIKRDFPDLIIINQPASNITELSQQFSLADEDVMQSNRLYLVDSLGYLMMSYKPSLPLAVVRKDITHLLRYSWAG